MGYKRLRESIYSTGLSGLAANYYSGYGLGEVAVLGASGSRTQTQTKMRKRGPVSIEVAEYERTYRRKGKKARRNLKNLYKMVSPQMTKVIHRFQSMNEFCTSAHGANKIFYHYDTVAGNLYLPVHVYDLSEVGVTGNILGGGGVAYVGATNTVSFTGTGANVGIVAQNTNPDGTSFSLGQATWALETAENPSAVYRPVADILEWIDISLLTYGRSTRPTRFRVDLCVIPDEEYSPAVNWSVNGLQAYLSKQGTAGWEACAAPYMFNPIMHYDNKNNEKRVIKSIMHEDFILGSTTTIEGSSSVGHMKKIKMFYRANRKQNYIWKSDDTLGAVAGIGGDDDYIKQQGNISQGPHWKSRLYLVIRAMSAYTTAAGVATWSVANHPSYDLLVRKKHVAINYPAT